MNSMCELGQARLPFSATLMPCGCSTVCVKRLHFQGGVSLTSMAERTLGKAGARLAGVTYLFLHYALLVACALPCTTRILWLSLICH